MYKIDKNVPLPKSKSGPERKYPFAEMEIGDSFLVEAKNRHLAQRSSYMYNKNHQPKRIMCRTQPDGSLRVWRVK